MISTKLSIPSVLALFLLGSLLLQGCSWMPKAEKDMDNIAFVNGWAISYASFDSTVKANKAQATGNLERDKAKKLEILDELIGEVLIEQKTEETELALENDPEFQRHLREELSKKVLRLLYDDVVGARAEVTEEHIREYYEENKEQYKLHESIRASHILIRPDIDSAEAKNPRKLKRAKQKAQKKAASILAELKSGADFVELAKIHSQDDASKNRGGDLGVFTRGRMVPEFEEVAFSLPVGQLSDPVETEFGYHLIKVVEHTPEKYKELDLEVKNRIRRQLRTTRERDYGQAYVDSVRDAAHYLFNEEVLASSDTTFSDDLWVLVVNSQDTIYFEKLHRELPKYRDVKGLAELTAEDKKDMLKTLSLTRQLERIAEQEGYYQHPEMAEERQKVMEETAESRVRENLTAKDYVPTEEELAGYYNDHLDEYTVERPLHVYHIIFSDSAFAEVILDSIRGGADFVEMAKRYYPGEKEIREIAYDLDFISDRELSSEFFEAADRLKEGEVGGPVRTEWGHHIIKLVERKRSRTLQQMRTSIRQILKREKDEVAKKSYIKKLRVDAEVEVNDWLLDRYVITSTAQIRGARGPE